MFKSKLHKIKTYSSTDCLSSSKTNYLGLLAKAYSFLHQKNNNIHCFNIVISRKRYNFKRYFKSNIFKDFFH